MHEVDRKYDDNERTLRSRIHGIMEDGAATQRRRGRLDARLSEHALALVAQRADAHTLAALRSSGRRGRDSADVALTRWIPRIPPDAPCDADDVRSKTARVRLCACALARRTLAEELLSAFFRFRPDPSRLHTWRDFLTLTSCAVAASGMPHAEYRLNRLVHAGALVSPPIEVRWWNTLADSSASRWCNSLLGPGRGDAPLAVALRYNNHEAAHALLRLGAIPQTPARDLPKLPSWVQARHVLWVHNLPFNCYSFQLHLSFSLST